MAADTSRLARLTARERHLDLRRRLRGHPLRAVRRRHRQDHDRPARGPQRVPAGDADRGLRGAGARPRGHLGGRDHPHRRGPGRVLLGRRPARARRHRVHARRGAGRALPRDGPARAVAPAAEADRRHGGGLRDRRRARAAPRVRPHDRRRQRPLRAGRAAWGVVRRRLRREPAGPARRPQEGQGDLVPVPPVRRRGGPRDAHGQRRRAARAPRGGDRRLVPRDARALAFRAADDEGELPRRGGRLRRHPAARARRQPPLLRQRRGEGGPRGLQGQAPARLRDVPQAALSPWHIWLMAARPRTLPAAAAPVLVGTALAGTLGTFKPLTFAATLLGALFIQIGTNLSNDYSDARRGADTEDRLGPVRVTAGGLVPPRQVLVATYVSFGLAVLCGIYLIAVAGPVLLLIGAASILAGVLYTGGPRPYGYEGLGELFVFLFFGVVAVSGSYFAQTSHMEWEALVLSVPVGLLATGILVVNNVRDLETDRRAGKRTLVVRLGRDRARALYAALVYGAFLTGPLTWALGAAG